MQGSGADSADHRVFTHTKLIILVSGWRLETCSTIPRDQDMVQIALDAPGQGMNLFSHHPPKGCEVVFDMGWDNRQRGAVHKPVFFQNAQGLGQHPLGHAADPAAQTAEPVGATLQDDQNQNAPSAGHVVQGLSRGAFLAQNIGGSVGRKGFGHGPDTYIFVRTSVS